MNVWFDVFCNFDFIIFWLILLSVMGFILIAVSVEVGLIVVIWFRNGFGGIGDDILIGVIYLCVVTG